MKIKKITIKRLWNVYNIEWKIDSSVAILSGINGSGKSTILRAVGTVLKGEFLSDTLQHKLSAVIIEFDDNRRIDVRTFHESLSELKKKAKRDESVAVLVERIKKESEQKSNKLDMRVDAQTYDLFDGTQKLKREELVKNISSDFISTFDYAPKKPEDSTKILEYIVNAQYSELDRHLDAVIARYKSYLIELSNQASNMMVDMSDESRTKIESVRALFNSRNKLHDIIDEFFRQTHKKINRDKGDLEFIFTDDKSSHPCSDLSAGEKQLILILLTVFMQGQKSSILVMDEPEISLHVDWQQILLQKILEINPQCQILVSTHSPSMILDGWQGSVVNLATLSQNI